MVSSDNQFDSVFGTTPITDGEFQAMTNLIYHRSGICLNATKRTLLISRLGNHVKSLGFKSFRQYYKYLLSDHTGESISTLVNLISTNHTFFFRENDHFVFLKNKALPHIVRLMNAKKDRDLRIWCAAASTGEEPYSIMMTMMDFFAQSYSEWNAGLLATDISDAALNTARIGVYDQDRVQSIPPYLRYRFLKKKGNDEWEVSQQLKKEITYRRFNLMDRPLPFNKPFHIIFCRNVMIYFNNPTKKELCQTLFNHTVPGGYLFIGHSESLGGLDVNYRYVAPAIYQH